MLGVFLNVATIVCGSVIGVFFKRLISEKISRAVMQAMGLATFFIGIQGALKGEKTLVLIVSIVVGTIIGSIIDVDKYFNLFGELIKSRFVKKDDTNNANAFFVDAFVNATVLFCVGALAILGSIDAGIKHDYNIFILKSTLDFVSAMMLSTTMGIGVAFSGISILIYQGFLTIFASQFQFLASNVGMMNELSCIGNVLIIAIGLNLLSVTKIKIANMIPAIFLSPLIFYLFSFFSK